MIFLTTNGLSVRQLTPCIDLWLPLHTRVQHITLSQASLFILQVQLAALVTFTFTFLTFVLTLFYFGVYSSSSLLLAHTDAHAMRFRKEEEQEREKLSKNKNRIKKKPLTLTLTNVFPMSSCWLHLPFSFLSFSLDLLFTSRYLIEIVLGIEVQVKKGYK